MFGAVPIGSPLKPPEMALRATNATSPDNPTLTAIKRQGMRIMANTLTFLAKLIGQRKRAQRQAETTRNGYHHG